MTTEATVAQQISARYGDDGQIWNDRDGVHIEDACRAAHGRRDRNDNRDCTRYTFSDGSVLTLAGGGWDYGYSECYCWLGAGHEESCERLGPCYSCRSHEADPDRDDHCCEDCGHAIDDHAASVRDAYAVECDDHDHESLSADEARHWLDLDVILARHGVEPEDDLTPAELASRLEAVGAGPVDVAAARAACEARS